MWNPDHGLNLCPLQWKHKILTTGLSGKSQDFTFFKMTILPKFIYRSSATLIKIQTALFCKNRQVNPKIHAEIQEI